MAIRSRLVSTERDAGLQTAFGILGKKWNGRILAALREGPMKFTDLRRAVGAITDSVLSDRLVDLAEAGLVERAETRTRPVHITYRLSQRGENVQPVLDDLAVWAVRNLEVELPRN
ncbi:winged helix-turn-helix transcriptional regulator [Microbacterium sp. A94]|uniref:winged helix-turn-helix transcriptional regulator n=1 Tax=Microbacterium sp. A94 TaxID=3450717 RepID=UPI003F42A2AA